MPLKSQNLLTLSPPLMEISGFPYFHCRGRYYASYASTESLDQNTGKGVAEISNIIFKQMDM